MKIKKKIVIMLMLMCSAFTIASPKIAVVDFDSQQHGGNFIGAQLAEYVIDELVNTNLFEVVERDKMQTIMREQGFSASGLVDTTDAVQMGRLFGARYLLTGKVISLNKTNKDFNGYGVNSSSTIFTISVSIRIFDAERGSIVFSGRDKSTHSITSAGGLSISSNNVYEPLAENSAIALVEKIKNSGKFKENSNDSVQKVKLINVFIDSKPAGADVEIDGVFYGNAGAEISIPSGQHEITISLAGYNPWQKKVMVNEKTKIIATLSEIKQ